MKVFGIVVGLAAAALPLGAAAGDAPPPPVVLTAPASRAELPPSGVPLSLVLITGSLGAKAGCGAGVIVGEDRDHVTIVTAAHVLAMDRVRITTVSGERLRIERSTVVAGHDLAFVTAARPWRRYEVARPARAETAGTPVRVWGPTGDDAFAEQHAALRELDPRIPNPPDGAFAIDCPACGHGDSGTGVFDGRNELVGIVVAGYTIGGKPLLVLGERLHPAPAVATNPLSP